MRMRVRIGTNVVLDLDEAMIEVARKDDKERVIVHCREKWFLFEGEEDVASLKSYMETVPSLQDLVDAQMAERKMMDGIFQALRDMEAGRKDDGDTTQGTKGMPDYETFLRSDAGDHDEEYKWRSDPTEQEAMGHENS